MTIEDIHEYNSELKEFCKELWENYPPGQKKKWMKNPRIKALLIKFHIIDENTK